MATPNRWSLVGNWDFEVRGKVRNEFTKEEFNGMLRFTGSTAGVHTYEVDGKRKADLHTEIVEKENSTDLWDLVIFDEPKTESTTEEPITINDDELVEFIASQSSNLNNEDIQKVLDLEFEFLKLKGVVE